MIMLEATYVVNLSVTQITEIKCDSIFNVDKGRIINARNQDEMIERSKIPWASPYGDVSNVCEDK